MEVLSEEGLGAIGKALELLLNEATRAERAALVGAVPGERTRERVGHAKGFKPKTVTTRLAYTLGSVRAGRCDDRSRPSRPLQALLRAPVP